MMLFYLHGAPTPLSMMTIVLMGFVAMLVLFGCSEGVERLCTKLFKVKPDSTAHNLSLVAGCFLGLFVFAWLLDILFVGGLNL